MRRQLLPILGLGGFLVLVAHPAALAASDIWGNVAPASPLGSGGLFGRYPFDHYALDQHFDAVEASLTGGVKVDGVPPMIAYFLASVLWVVTSFLANALISLFSFAFSLDLLNGSSATGGAGALAPVARAIHSIYSDVFGGPWLVLAISVVGIWAMWKALVQRRYSETAGALALSLIYIVIALFFVVQPGSTIGSASRWTNAMSGAFLSVAERGEPSGAAAARDDAANQLFELLVFKPWVVLNFGGLEHCAVAGTGDEESDPESAAVRPLSGNASRDAQLARRLAAGDEVTAEGKVCFNNANKYARHFLRFGFGTDERDSEYDALEHGDSSKLPDADPEAAGYKLGVYDKPATDAMEKGGQYQRLLIALIVFVGELGAFLLLGSLSVGIILAQVLLLVLLAFAPVALVAAAIPGRGHAFFKGWLEKLAGYLLRKAAYSLILAVLLAVNGALASATAAMGWLMSFSLQALFFWTVFLQRQRLAESLIGIATGPGAPARDSTNRVLALYAGARTLARPIGRGHRGSRSGGGAPGRTLGGFLGRIGRGGVTGVSPRTPRFGTSYSAPVGGGVPSMDAPGPAQRAKAPATERSGGETKSRPGADTAVPNRSSRRQGKRAVDSPPDTPAGADQPRSSAGKRPPARAAQRPQGGESGGEGQPPATSSSADRSGTEEGSLAENLRREREGSDRKALPQSKAPGGEKETSVDPAEPSSPPRRQRRKKRKGQGR